MTQPIETAPTPEKQRPLWIDALVVLGLCLIPFAILWLIFTLSGKTLADYHFIISDETDYWIEALTMKTFGLFNRNAGYFGYAYQQHAPFLNYGAHGIFNLLPYVVTVAILPRGQYTALFTNAAMLSLGVIANYFLAGNLKKSVQTSLLMFSFAPLLLYFFTGMMEVPLYAGLFLIIPLWQRALQAPVGKKRWFFAYLGVVFFFSLFRITWYIFVIPLFFLELWKEKKNIWGLIAKYLALGLLSSLIFWLTSANYPWYFISMLMRSGNKLEYFIRHGLSQAYHFVWPVGVDAFEVSLRYAFLAWFLILVVLLIRGWKHGDLEQRISLLSQVLVLFGNLIFLIFFYEIQEFRSVRYLGAILIFSIILTLTSSHSAVFPQTMNSLALALCLLPMSVMIAQKDAFYADIVQSRLKAVERSSVLQAIAYDPQANNHWDNTVYLNFYDDTAPDFNNYEPGLGFMFIKSDELDDALALAPAHEALRARYLLTSEEDVAWPGYERLDKYGRLLLYRRVAP